jgi:hypothetical protein
MSHLYIVRDDKLISLPFLRSAELHRSMLATTAANLAEILRFHTASVSFRVRI